MRKLLLALGFLSLWLSPAASQQVIGPPALLCNKVAAASLASGTTQVIVGVAGVPVHICGYVFEGLANGTVQLIAGTGSSCTTSTNITENFTTQVNGNVVDHIPYAYFSSLVGQSVCAVVTGAGTVLTLHVYFGQY